MTPLKSLSRIEGPNLAIRLIQTEDAEYLYGLRSDEKYNRHLSEVSSTAEDQRRWIEAYKVRESEGQEYYFIVERLDGLRCGTVRLYDISDNSFTWGSWILDHNKTRKAALESAILSFGVGFNILGFGSANVEVRADNSHAVQFYRRFGMEETHRTDHEIFFVYARARFEADLAAYFALLNKEART